MVSTATLSSPSAHRRDGWVRLLGRVGSVAARSTEWIVLVGLLVAFVPPIVFRQRSLTVIPWLTIVDGSWVLDMNYKAARGVWSGWDVFFTYGPLYQWLSSAPSRWLGPSVGTIYATSHTLPFLLTTAFAFLTARILMPSAAPWRRALFVLLAVLFWSAPDLRVWFCLLAFAAFTRLTHPLPAPAGAALLRAAAAAAICIAGFLISADTGIYTVAALLLCCLAAMLPKETALTSMTFLAITPACFLAGTVVVNAFMSSPFDFKFWRASLDLAAGYRWFEPLAMRKSETRLVISALALGTAVFGVAWLWRKPGRQGIRRPESLLAGFALALLMMQSALVRSDYPHVRVGISAMLILCGMIVLDEQLPGGARLIPVAIAAVVTLLFARAEPEFTLAYLSEQGRAFVRPAITCPDGWEELDGACLPKVQAETLSLVSQYVDRNSSPTRSIVIFPYETLFGLTSRRDVAGGIAQSYLVNGDYLTQLEIAGLQQKRPLFGLYFPDGILGDALDSVPSFTRSPGLWFYLVGHYRGETSPMPGAAGLITDDTRAARLTFAEQTIAKPLGSVAVAQRATTLRFGPVHWPNFGADFLKLRLRLEYPLWWHIRKPSRLTLRISFADGSEKSIQFVVEPSHTSDIWFYPWDDRTMIGYFSSNPALWRLGPRPSVTTLTLMIDPFDWVSVTPSNISIQSVEAIRLGMN